MQNDTNKPVGGAVREMPTAGRYQLCPVGWEGTGLLSQPDAHSACIVVRQVSLLFTDVAGSILDCLIPWLVINMPLMSSLSPQIMPSFI